MKRILILESNEPFARELSEHFSNEGYEVCGVTGDGAEGIKLLESTGAGLVVMNLLLRTADGFTVLEESKKSGRKVDFVVLGSFADDKIISRAIALGARYYLMKPVSAQLVGERVAEIALEGSPKAERYERKRAMTPDERITDIFISIGIPPHSKKIFSGGKR